MLVAALVATVLVVSWIWNKTDALTPISLPSANGKPLETISPSAKPEKTLPPPEPVGKYVGAFMVATNGDKMPGMSSAWKEDHNRIGLYGGIGLWLTVHPKYNGSSDFGNHVGFGALPKEIAYKPTPAGLRSAAAHVGGRLINRLYHGQNLKPTNVVHKPMMVNGHRAHEITARVPINEPQLKETFAIIAITVVDKGDGTAMVAIADLCGSTPQWLTVWRQRVTKMLLS
ncbi:hypothetical protein [Kribbella deserti]|uniref:Class F sortase n=1 Tax=Kribbella deserti TaxID=1926257 RepID=A0ABV6QIR3_9ACTN